MVARRQTMVAWRDKPLLAILVTLLMVQAMIFVSLDLAQQHTSVCGGYSFCFS